MFKKQEPGLFPGFSLRQSWGCRVGSPGPSVNVLARAPQAPTWKAQKQWKCACAERAPITEKRHHRGLGGSPGGVGGRTLPAKEVLQTLPGGFIPCPSQSPRMASILPELS